MHAYGVGGQDVHACPIQSIHACRGQYGGKGPALHCTSQPHARLPHRSFGTPRPLWLKACWASQVAALQTDQKESLRPPPSVALLLVTSAWPSKWVEKINEKIIYDHDDAERRHSNGGGACGVMQHGLVCHSAAKHTCGNPQINCLRCRASVRVHDCEHLLVSLWQLWWESCHSIQ